MICGLTIALAGAAPEPLRPAEPEPPLGAYPIYGAWEIARFEIAPWVDQAEDRTGLQADGATRHKLKIEFAPNEVISKDEILGCTAAHYQPTNYPAEAIFQGNLPEPDQEKLAGGLGLPQGDIPGFDLDCSTGLFSYHFANADTLLFALSDVVYWLARQK
jgi:hypothetical protein